MRLSAILIALIVMLPAVLSGQHYYSMAGERPETDIDPKCAFLSEQ